MSVQKFRADTQLQGTVPGANLPASVFTEFYESGEISLVANSILSASHGLSGIPRLLVPVLRCKIAEKGYAIGDELPILIGGNGTGNTGSGAFSNATVVGLAADEQFSIINKSAFTLDGSITLANWRLVFRAWR